MIRFSVFGDRFVCEQDGQMVFEIYPVDEDNDEHLRVLITALSDLKNDKHVADTVIDFEEA